MESSTSPSSPARSPNQTKLDGCDAFSEAVDPSTSAAIHGFNTVEEASAPPNSTATRHVESHRRHMEIQEPLLLTPVLLADQHMAGIGFTQWCVGPRTDGEDGRGSGQVRLRANGLCNQDDFEASPKRAKGSHALLFRISPVDENVAKIVAKGGHTCYVVGNRTVKGVQVPTDQFTAWAFEQQGFTHVVTYVRDIPNKRMPSKNSPSNQEFGKTAPTMTENS